MVEVYEQADGTLKANSQGRMVVVVVGDDGYIDPTKNRGDKFGHVPAHINAYIPPTPPIPPTPKELREQQYDLRGDPILRKRIEPYEREYKLTGREDLPVIIAAAEADWLAEREAIRAEYPDEV